MPSDFERDSLYHKALKKLRRKHLIRPEKGGKWKVNKFIELTAFGEAAIRKYGGKYNLDLQGYDNSKIRTIEL
jgi:hypothetical protein